MPQELPGFYYDPEKNRYFPIKGPIPGTSRSQKPILKPTPKPERNQSHGKILGTSKLLQGREFSGNIVSLKTGRHNFKEEFHKRLVSQPTVWKYQNERIGHGGDGALEQIHVDVIKPEGQYRTALLLAGSMASSTVSFFEVGKVGQEVPNGIKYTPYQVWPRSKGGKVESYGAPDLIWNASSLTNLSSSISCIRLLAKQSTLTTDDGHHLQRALITTLGSETTGGSVFVLKLVDPINSDHGASRIRRSSHRVSSFSCTTIWTADCDYNGDQAVIGTDHGAAVVNLETGMHSWVLRSKSDVLAQQLLLSGNVVLNGLRNGAIVTIDIRERPTGTSNRLIAHRIPCSLTDSTGPSSRKQWFKLKGNICPSSTIFMPSSISSLVSLHFNDQYFLASSMDGSIKLYDHRLIKRGPVQSYEGHVNSHTRIQLGVDPSERFVMSGGEDCNLRIWSIRSGEMLFEEKFTNSVPTNVCWRRPKSFMEMHNRRQIDEDSLSGNSYGSADVSDAAWVRTQKGIFRMLWY